jgi:hypothetical protein
MPKLECGNGLHDSEYTESQSSALQVGEVLGIWIICQ